MDESTPAPSRNSSSLDDRNIVALLVTKLGQNKQRVRQSDAFTWATVMLRKIITQADAKWEGTLDTVIPLTEQVDGFLYKMVFEDMPEDLLHNVIIPGMRVMACTARMEPHAVTAMHRKSVRDIGNVGSMRDTVNTILQMRGNGGPEAKKRKFSSEAMNILYTSVKVGSHKLAENKEDDA
jgi:hypothetical protein